MNKINASAMMLTILAAILWGTTGTAQSFAPDHSHPLVIGSLRLLIGGGSLLVYVWIKGKIAFLFSKRDLLIAAISMAAYQPLFFTVVDLSGIAVGTVVAIGSAPIITGVVEYMIYRRKLAVKWWASTGLGIVGIVLLFMPFENIDLQSSGIYFALGAGGSFALYTIVSKNISEQADSEGFVALVFSLAAIFLTPFLFFYPISWVFTLKGTAVVFHLGIVTTALAYILFNYSLRRIPASYAVTLSLTEPLTAACLGAFVVGETLIIKDWAGIGLILTGVTLLTIPKTTILNRQSKNEYTAE